MKILLVTATEAEVRPFLDSAGSGQTEHLITGVGILATAYQMAVKLSAKKYDLLINAGICGAIAPSIAPGKVVEISEEYLYGFGAEDNDNFIDAFELGLMNGNDFPFNNKRLINNSGFPDQLFPGLKKVKGITVQTVHGNAASIEKLKALNPEAEAETMEGAAFFYAALTSGIPFVQIRAISNYVEPRNRASWKINEAIKNLNDVLIKGLYPKSAT